MSKQDLFPIGVLYARTRTLIKTYRNINAVVAAGFDGEAVLGAIAGKHIYAGRRWRNMAEVEPVPPDDQSLVRRFLLLSFFPNEGHIVRFAEVYAAFVGSLPLEEKLNWSKVRFSRALPEEHRSGSASANVAFVINLADKPALPAGTRLAVNSRGHIVKVPRAA